MFHRNFKKMTEMLTHLIDVLMWHVCCIFSFSDKTDIKPWLRVLKSKTSFCFAKNSPTFKTLISANILSYCVIHKTCKTLGNSFAKLFSS